MTEVSLFYIEETKGVIPFMKFYLAPLEGLTGYIYRNAYTDFFGPLEKIFTPFMAAYSMGKLSSRELNDILPEHNLGQHVIPQILTNKAEDFIRTVETLQNYGYNEVNLNLGCPSGTVVSKNRGSGFLSQKEALNRFLEEVFSKTNVKISIKTRIGKDNPSEMSALMAIFNQYPLEELIIHPRIQNDYYKNKPNLEVFRESLVSSKNPVVYNGDLFTKQDYLHFEQQFPTVDTVMLGRGLLANPGLLNEINHDQMIQMDTFIAFHHRLLKDYQEVLYGDKNVLFKMKEMWFYMGYLFTNPDKYLKKIRKAQRVHDYLEAVEKLCHEQSIAKGAGLFSTPRIND